jgi:hypothetical protein
MPTTLTTDARTLTISALVAGCIITALFLWQGRVGFSLYDEGYLWYGAQRILKGDVPIRDYLAYDPGRYYWSAAVMSLAGNDGIVVVRIAAAIVQAVGMFLALLLLARNSGRGNWVFLAFAVATLALWMFPREKYFDITASIAAIATLAFLAERPSPTRYFASGVLVGLLAILGRNHGLYAACGILALIAYLNFGRATRAFLCPFLWWSAGVVVGYLPMIGLLLLVPGFADAYLEHLGFVFEWGATNIPLPVPWPWQVPFGQHDVLDSTRRLLVGVLFCSLLVYGVFGIAYAIRAKLKKQPVPPLLLATFFLSLPYAHYAFSRSDIIHLALGIFPFLIGILALLASAPKPAQLVGALLLVATSVFVGLPQQPGWQARQNPLWIEAEAGSDKLLMDPGTAGDLLLLQTMRNLYAAGGQTFFVAPFWPGAYAAFGVRSPTRDIYQIHPQSTAFQQAEIKRLQIADPGFALVLDLPLDGRDDLRFRNTNPMIERYLRENFDRLEGVTPISVFQIYKRRAPSK